MYSKTGNVPSQDIAGLSFSGMCPLSTPIDTVLGSNDFRPVTLSLGILRFVAFRYIQNRIVS